MSNKTKIFTIIVVFLLIGILTVSIGLALAFSGGNAFQGATDKDDILCTAQIKNPVGFVFISEGAVEIETFTCTRQPATSCFQISPFSLFGGLGQDSGELILNIDGDKRDRENYEITEGTTRTFQLKATCVSKARHTTSLIVNDESGQEIKQRTITV